MDQFWAAPPVTRTLAAAIFVESLAVAAKALGPHRLIFAWPYILKSFPEVWRFATSFLITGGIGIVLVPYCSKPNDASNDSFPSLTGPQYGYTGGHLSETLLALTAALF